MRVVSHDKEGDDVAHFFATGGRFEIPDANSIASWFEQVLSDPDYADTTRKLLRLDAEERYVFLMTGSGTDFGVEERIRRARGDLPTRDPVVPDGITRPWGDTRFDLPDPRAVLWSNAGWETVVTPS